LAVYEEVLLEIDDPVATLTLNRPEKLNALTDRTLQELRHALAAAERDERVVGVVLTGAGRGFCAGVDMGALKVIQEAGEIAAMHAETGLEPLEPGDREMGADFAGGLAYMMTLRKPLIAAVNGPAAGMGFSLAMFCDLRFMAEEAVLVTAYAQRGLVAEHGMSWVLPRLVGPSRALDLLWSGRRIAAEEALTLGLANRVVPGAGLLDAAREYVRTLAATVAPTSLMQMKRQVYRHLMQPLGEAMRETDRLVDESIRRPDFEEGIAAFVERRAPRFGRVSV
jgi:enoyl-CoA hydratase/carnithine racemase